MKKMKLQYLRCWAMWYNGFMIDSTRTLKELNINCTELTKGSATKVWFICDDCSATKLKPYRDCVNGVGLCSHCFRLKRGKELGDSFGKAQTLTNTCLYCDTPIRSNRKTCKKHTQQHLSNIRSGINNPAWTGKHVCGCGEKKSPGARECRMCSFKHGKRSGSNNGRWQPDRAKLLAARIARTLLANTMTHLGIKKNRRTVELLGYDFKTLRKHLESKFESWMTWDNYGTSVNSWQVDHIIPVTVLINNGITEPSIINALWNLRPFKTIKNIRRSNKPDKLAKSLALEKLNIKL